MLDALSSSHLHGHGLLQIWLSPSFPVGTFAYSHGLEKAVELSWVRDRASLQAWLGDLITHGGMCNDLILLTAAYAAMAGRDGPGMRAVADLSAAMQPTAERYLEASQQGRSFLQQIDAAWPVPDWSCATAFADTSPTLAVALGVAASGHRVPADATANAYALGFSGGLISAAIRLSVIGQSDGQKILAALMPRIADAVALAAVSTLDHLGSATFRGDIASMQHETQYTRLFRS
jgi:urease accessory protein